MGIESFRGIIDHVVPDHDVVTDVGHYPDPVDMACGVPYLVPFDRSMSGSEKVDPVVVVVHEVGGYLEAGDRVKIDRHIGIVDEGIPGYLVSPGNVGIQADVSPGKEIVPDHRIVPVEG